MTRSVACPSTSDPVSTLPALQLAADLPQRVHMLGIGGAGVSGAARLLLARGHRITGADRAMSPFVRSLRQLGVPVAIESEGPKPGSIQGSIQGASGRLPDDAQVVVRSAAVPESSPELEEARRRGLAILKYSDLLGRLCPARRTLAVSGTHGKTTSSWMLYHALAGIAHLDGTPAPGALVGGTELALGSNAIAPGAALSPGTPGTPGAPGIPGAPGLGGWFAVEACEYDRTFLKLAPQGAIVTNVEADHLDYYGTLDAVEEAFARFLDRVHPDGLVVCGRDVPERVLHAAEPRVWRLGRELHVDLTSQRDGCFEFRLRGPGWATPPIQLAVPGAFNVDNAALAIALAVGLAGGASAPAETAGAAARAVAGFRGVGRRFERWCRQGEIEVIHDYAHHPTEVRVNLEAARRTAPDKPLHVLFQPHQHSRTARFLGEFVESLRGADRVVVADVYGARLQIDAQAVGAEELVRRLKQAHVNAVLGGPAFEAGRILVRELPKACTVLVLGAGDIDGIREDLEERLAVRGPAPCVARG